MIPTLPDALAVLPYVILIVGGSIALKLMSPSTRKALGEAVLLTIALVAFIVWLLWGFAHFSKP